MSIRPIQFTTGEYYHVFTRGIDKRSIILDQEDSDRFLLSIQEFNTIDPIGSIYENSFRKISSNSLGGNASKSSWLTQSRSKGKKLVDFVCYCLNPNHYHFILKQSTSDGIKKFMHRLGTGYALYFNNKYKRTGSLFQRPFKAVHIDSNEYLLHVSAYVNLNGRAHQLGGNASKLVRSSWGEYINVNTPGLCVKDMILGQFENVKEYKNFSENSLEWIKENKEANRYFLE